jgi:FLVCR family MFS transporter
VKAHAQVLSANLGFGATVAGCVAGIGVGFVSDWFGGKMKPILICLSALSGVCYLFFQLAVMYDWSQTVLYITAIVGGFFLNGTIPLFYEAGVELSFPVAEGSTTCLITTMNNVGCLIFLFLPSVKSLSDNPAWANWSLVAACTLGVVLLFPVKFSQMRTAVDKAGNYDIN